MNRKLCATCDGRGWIGDPFEGSDRKCPNQKCDGGTVEVVPDRRHELSRVEDSWESRVPFVGSCE